MEYYTPWRQTAYNLYQEDIMSQRSSNVYAVLSLIVTVKLRQLFFA